MKAAVIKDGIVINTIQADADIDTAPEGTILVNVGDTVAIGFSYNEGTGEFTAPPIPEPTISIPDRITPRQARLMLLQMGMLATVEAMIATQDEATKIAWEYSTEFTRNHPLLAALAVNIGITDEQLDTFFIGASAL